MYNIAQKLYKGVKMNKEELLQQISNKEQELQKITNRYLQEIEELKNQLSKYSKISTKTNLS